MSYNLRNYRHRNPKGKEETKTGTPFFQSPEKATGKKKGQSGGSFFQAKLAVGQPGDSFEKEADAAASQVSRQQTPTQSADAKGGGAQKKELPGLQRLATSKEDEKLGTNDARMEKDKEEPMKPVQMKGGPDKEKDKTVKKKEAPEKEKDKSVKKKEAPDKEKEKPVQKKENADEKKKKKPVQKAAKPDKDKKDKPVQKEAKQDKDKKEKPVQKKGDGKEEKPTTSDQVAEEIKAQSGKGSPLPPKVLAEMSKSFGVDFSHVRIHSDMVAAKLCQELNALAFTHGQDIYFNEGKFNPESPEGKMLLAHELTHVVQQSNSDMP